MAQRQNVPILQAVSTSPSTITLTSGSVRADVIGIQFQFAGNVQGPWQILSGGMGVLQRSIQHNGLPAGDTVFYRVLYYFSTGAESFSLVVMATTSSLALAGQIIDVSTGAAVLGSIVNGTSGIRYTFGHWLEMDRGSGGGGLSGWITQINQAASLGFVGVIFHMNWIEMEFAQGTYTSGSINQTTLNSSTALGFALVDYILQACENANIQLALLYDDRSFSTPTYSGVATANLANLPSYFNTLSPTGGPGFVVAPTTTNWGGLGGIARIDQSWVQDREIALGTAYLKRYNSSSHFEGISSPETAVNGGAGLSAGGILTCWQRWGTALRPVGPNCDIRVSTNFLGNDTQMNQLMTVMAASAISAGGPDDNIPYAGNTGFGQSNAQVTYLGSRGIGAPFNGIIPWMAEGQYPDVIGANYHGWSCLDMWNFWTLNKTIAGVIPSPNPSDWGGINPGKYAWFHNNGSTGVTTSSVGANIKNMPVNKSTPSSFLAFK